MIEPTIQPLCATPRVWEVTDFADQAFLDRVRELGTDAATLERHAVYVAADKTGLSGELVVKLDPCLEQFRDRLETLFDLENRHGSVFRFRKYQSGEFHPLHNDTYDIDEDRLVLTAMLYLNEPQSGGETHFPKAAPMPLSFAPKTGSLLVWFSLDQAGETDPLAVHESLPVGGGTKETITCFLYRPIGETPDFGPRSVFHGVSAGA